MLNSERITYNKYLPICWLPMCEIVAIADIFRYLLTIKKINFANHSTVILWAIKQIYDDKHHSCLSAVNIISILAIKFMTKTLKTCAEML